MWEVVAYYDGEIVETFGVFDSLEKATEEKKSLPVGGYYEGVEYCIERRN